MSKKKSVRASPKPRRGAGPIGVKGERVRAARASLHLSQFEIAKRSNITPSALSLVESGQKELTALSLKSLAVALEVTSDYLLGLSDDLGRK